MKRFLPIAALLLLSGVCWAACTATEKNANYSAFSSTTTASLTATVDGARDLIIFSAWCYQTCTPTSLVLGSTNAVLTSTHTPGTTVGIDGLHTGQGYIYYILSASASGSFTATFTQSGGSQTQMSYIDYSISSGCAAIHHLDSTIGTGTGGGTANAPTISGVSGDVLFNFVVNTQHVNAAAGSPWSCPTYAGTGDCSFDTTRNGVAYILSGGSSDTTNWGLINSSTGWESVISSFSMTNVRYISAGGADTNDGLTKTTTWAHAPGMPSCASTCAAFTPVTGTQIIFKGGDTWHFGNSGRTPYTGGTWNWTWSGTSSCDTSDNPAAVRTSCIYVGVDPTWFTGGSWTRPILSGDNPTSTTAVGSCTYPNVGSSNLFLTLNNDAFAIFDNFEFTGLCQNVVQTSGNNGGFGQNFYIFEIGRSVVQSQNVFENLYFHGWTHIAIACTAEARGICLNEGAYLGRLNGSSTFGPGNVCDGWDSDPTMTICMNFAGYLVYDNVFANQAQIVVNGYHDWHDNYWFGYYPTGDGFAHGNSFESNVDAPQVDNGGHSQPNIAFNVFYNNILGHNATGTSGDVKLWFCVNNTAAEYQFNNIVYDQGAGNNWDIDTACGGGQPVYEFNNTVDMPAASSMNCTANLVAKNIHEIVEGSSAFQSGSCSISNVTVMTHAQAVTQGYMASGKGTSGSNSNVTCANDTTPCAPTSNTNSTVGAGGNDQTRCSELLAANDTTDGLNIVRAGTACQSDTTDACSYNTSTRSVSCPGRTVNARPASTAWDVEPMSLPWTTPQPQMIYYARTDVAAQAYPGSIPCPGPSCTAALGTLTGANFQFVPSDFSTTPYIRITDGSTTATNHLGFIPACSASSEVNLFGPNDDYFWVCQKGGQQDLFAFNAVAKTATYVAGTLTMGSGPLVSHARPYVTYAAKPCPAATTGCSQYDLTIFEYDLTGLSSIPTPTVTVDLTTACSLPTYSGAAFTADINVSLDDNSFSTAGCTSGTCGQDQAGAIYAIFWNRTNGCSYWNTSTGTVYDNGTLLGTVSTNPGAYTIHNAREGSTGAFLRVELTSGPDSYYVWTPFSLTVNGATNGNSCGHLCNGATHIFNKCQDTYLNGIGESPYNSLGTWTSLPAIYPSPDQGNSAHVTCANTNATDTAPFFLIFALTSATYPTYAWDNELLRAGDGWIGKDMALRPHLRDGGPAKSSSWRNLAGWEISSLAN